MVVNETLLIVKDESLPLETNRIRAIAVVEDGYALSFFASCSLTKRHEDAYLTWGEKGVLIKEWHKPTNIISQNNRSGSLQLIWADPE